MTPEEKKIYMKEYRKKNKERIAESKRLYREKNKEKISEYNKQYFSKYKIDKEKEITISHWRSMGVIEDDYEKIYDIWCNTNKCQKCNNEIIGYNKCLDHCHKTGKFRKILCRSCNTHNIEDDSYKNKKNIYYEKSTNKFLFIKVIKGQKFHKRFHTETEAIEYKKFIIEKYVLV
jgi:hypothetical protein